MPLKFIRVTLTAWLFFAALCANTAAAAVDVQVRPGFNVVGVSRPLQTQHVSAFPLLDTWKAAGITAIESYDHANSVLLRAELSAGVPSGSDFPLIENSALFVYSGSSTVVSLGDVAECSALSLKTGFNLAGFFCPPAGSKASDLINSLGISSVLSIAKFDSASARWITSAANGTAVVGEDFPIAAGEGFIIYAAADVSNWITPRQKLTFNPAALTLHQEETGLSLNLTIPYIASAGGVTVSLASSNTSTLLVPALVTIPAGTTSVSVLVTALATSSPVNAVVQVTASRPDWTSGSATVTVLPKMTVNLTPTTTLTGKGWTYFLTATLTEAAPAGGLLVTLTSSSTGVVSVPASVTVPEGATSAQVTATAVNPGSATITATSPQAISGTANVVTVKPVQTIDVGPVLGAPVGIMVGSPSSQTTVTVFYTPVTSSAVGVVVGSVMTGLSPDRGAIGTTDMLLRINGIGLASVNTVTFNPPDGITVQNGTLSPAGDGSYVDVHIAIDETATISQRTINITSPSGTIKPASPGANSFRVTYKQPEIWSLIQNYGVTGGNMMLQISGRNLQQASEIAFIPPDGIGIGNPPVVSSDGTTASVNIAIAANAATGLRAVKITTPGGVTPDAQSAFNTFEVRSAIPPIGSAYAVYTPIVSTSVGVMVQTAPTPTTQLMSYQPVASLPVGLTVGSTITSVSPVSGAIGSTNLMVRVNGVGLVSATSMTFSPSTGITIQGGTFTAAGDGSYAEAVIDIDQSAPLTSRTVMLGGITALPAAPGANTFRVTLPAPEILSIQPIRREVNSSFTLTVSGRNLNSASSIVFIPPTGITVANPPVVSTDGTTATVTVIISAGTPTGERVVTVTAPGGTTPGTATAANTFTITDLPSVNYTPVVSSQVGVLVSEPTPTTMQLAAYSPVLSPQVGVMVVSAPAPTTTLVNYAPIVSQAVGISVGSVITGITPANIEPGMTQDITIHGIGLSSVTTVTVQPSTGITVGVPTAAGDGLSAVVSITTTTAVAVGAKTVIVSSPSGTIPPVTAGVNRLLVGPQPVINSINPLQYAAGNTFTLTIFGLNLQGATEVRFLPATDIAVSNPPTVSPDGMTATVTVIIAFAAAGGDRAVTISTPYGTTSSAATAANTFTVVPQIGLNAPVQFEEGTVIARHAQGPMSPRENRSQLDPNAALLIVTVASRTGDEKRPALKTHAIDLAARGAGAISQGGQAGPKIEGHDGRRLPVDRGPPCTLV